ncbi:MAG: sulfatase-like hydrolase/transferase [Pirellulales bacterium]
MLGEKYLNPENYETGVDLGDNHPWAMSHNNDTYRWTFHNTANPKLSLTPLQDALGVVEEERFGSAMSGDVFWGSATVRSVSSRKRSSPKRFLGWEIVGTAKRFEMIFNFRNHTPCLCRDGSGAFFVSRHVCSSRSKRTPRRKPRSGRTSSSFYPTIWVTPISAAQGGKDIPTPHLDALARDGVRFTDAYANGSFCTPTRAALMSCRYQHRYAIEDLNSPLPKQANTLPERLKAVDYRTAMVGKWHLGGRAGYTPLDRGFESFFGFLGGGHMYFHHPDGKGEYNAPILRQREVVAETRYLTDAFGDEAEAFLETQRDATNPFFLYLAFNAVHTPVESTEKYIARFSAIENRTRRVYAAMLSAMDDAVGRTLAKLDAIGRRDDTLVVFTNDNGGPTTRNAVNGSQNAPLRGSKCETFEGGIRVPLFMRWPSVLKPGTVYRQPVITFDVSATALREVRRGDDEHGRRRFDSLSSRGENRRSTRRVVLAQSDDERQLRRARRGLEVRSFDRRRNEPRPQSNAGTRHVVQS